MTSIIIESFVKETEKAILVSVKVNFNGNAPKVRNVWFPKSVVKEMHENCISVEDWFVTECEWRNAFKGYAMRFYSKHVFEDAPEANEETLVEEVADEIENTEITKNNNDMETYNITKQRAGHDEVEIIDTYYSKEDALAALENMAANVDDDYMTWVDNEEDAREWLKEIESDEDQEDRADWLRRVIKSGVYGLYNLAMRPGYEKCEFEKGDETWVYDVYAYRIEGAND